MNNIITLTQYGLTIDIAGIVRDPEKVMVLKFMGIGFLMIMIALFVIMRIMRRREEYDAVRAVCGNQTERIINLQPCFPYSKGDRYAYVLYKCEPVVIDEIIKTEGDTYHKEWLQLPEGVYRAPILATVAQVLPGKRKYQIIYRLITWK